MSRRLAIFASLIFFPALCFASVESSLQSLQGILLNRILPIFAVMSFGLAAFQFFIGNHHAKQYLAWSIVGSAILFGSQSIVDLISRAVR
jgi:hypothetical protein